MLSATTAALLRDTLPEGAWLKDLGTHRLKDLGRSEQIFQLTVDGLPAAFPPLRALGSLKPPDNLPAQVSAFIGRESELTGVGRLIAASRLVTLTGSAGVGKTRLALRAAAGLPDGSADGVWFVDLASIQDPDLVTATVASMSTGFLPWTRRPTTMTWRRSAARRPCASSPTGPPSAG